ncbi:MAG: beta-lactamase family protein [Candidatus Eisenbacteria bacterium]|uniref:Beta-lactamase family protein n=1 Tax=Eiseniibacteriota bacterium TaxID=2212470 RepID=A0A538T9J8_UNCEI|nr:MAG: beta-lactamase family protein [Candidatus Eisenbacteria bacterium]
MPKTAILRAPASVSAFMPLYGFLQSRIEEGLVPGAVIAAGRGRGKMHRAALGNRALKPRPEAMTERTIFDLASLTKPAGAIPVSTLLTHTSGLPAMNPLEDYQRGKSALYTAIAREPVDAPPEERFVYSDVGYMLLQAVAERVSGKSLDRLSRERIFRPLGLTDTRFRPLATDRSRIAPTERERGSGGPWLRGRVHDPRARSRAMMGVAGNAGVFGTAEEVGRFCQMLLRGGLSSGAGGRRVLRRETVRAMTTNQCRPGLGVRRGFGFDIESPYDSPRGALFSGESYGHSGYTGVSMWIDPVNDAYFVLLTNSIHAGGHKDLKAFRSEAGTLAARGLGIER